MESKTYTYQEPYFTMEVKAEGAFCVLIFFACAWLIYTNAYNMWGLYVVFAVAALYQVWNTFVAWKLYICASPKAEAVRPPSVAPKACAAS